MEIVQHYYVFLATESFTCTFYLSRSEMDSILNIYTVFLTEWRISVLNQVSLSHLALNSIIQWKQFMYKPN